MPDREHAILSASGSNIWLNCPPSIRLTMDDKPQMSVAAEEGSLAHRYAELYIKKPKNYKLLIEEIKVHKLYKSEMDKYIKFYADYVKIRTKFLNADKTEYERVVSLEKYIPEGFGTCDAVLIGDGLLEIIDLKYGKGVLVNATDNPQLKIYALGAYELYKSKHNIKNIIMTIIQPRIHNIHSTKISVNKLIEWGETTLKPLAEMAFKGQGVKRTGAHCRFCGHRDNCETYIANNFEVLGD